MLVSAPFTANLARVDLDSQTVDSLEEGISSALYEGGTGTGFRELVQKPGFLSAKMVRTFPVGIQTFDVETEELEETQVNRTSVIPFRIDLDLGLIEVFSSSSEAENLLTKLGQATDWDISTGLVDINLAQQIDSLHKTVDFGLSRFRLKGRTIASGASSSCHVAVKSHQSGMEILKEHDGEITFIGGTLPVGSHEQTIGIYQSGSIRLYSQTDRGLEIMDTVKSVIFE